MYKVADTDSTFQNGKFLYDYKKAEGIMFFSLTLIKLGCEG